MADSSILNHAARVLNSITGELPADLALRRYLGTSARLGPREKRAISHAVFIYFRWLQWLDHKTSAQKQVDEALALNERFLKNPASVKAEALAARAIPQWSRDEVDWPAKTLRQLQEEPPLWIRARPGKTAALAAALGNCEVPPPEISSKYGFRAAARAESKTAEATPAAALTALRYKGSQDLFLTPQFHSGEFEIQDLASQLVGHACAPQPGQTWWDACAGEGGKLLHLADLMSNKGLIWASDRSERRLQSLKRRTARAKIYNYRATTWDGSTKLPTKTKFDGILLDAPCSGLGTWQRNPHARWTSSPEDVRELADVQRRMLEAVCGSIKPGGRLVYSVCTLTRSETAEVAQAFTAAHPEFEPTAVFPDTGKSETELASPACAVGETDAYADTQLTIWPHDVNANGMFIATWRRK
ncbi:RNA methyltransferase [Opitutaceae bacterium EW11]|nr:RNA methyltransferase [Opitutaceae bacterium EW11]